jgi:hypothetical protein
MMLGEGAGEDGGRAMGMEKDIYILAWETDA